MTPRDGLVVVVPARFDERRVPGIVKKHAAWVERAEARAAARRLALAERRAAPPPSSIHLPSLNEEWRVEYRRDDSPCAATVHEQTDGKLVVSGGGVDDPEACKAALRRWLARSARNVLEPWLLEVASELGFEVGAVQIRCQRTRWASCSPGKTVSLNVKLLFLPPDLVRFVLVHELCHTVELNHSKRFWKLVARHQPDVAGARRRLRLAWKELPDWLDSAESGGQT
jgi:predicted metal-dependent hydrolase